MLTFRFTASNGAMIIPDMLTSGMVGRQVKLEFSDDWAEFQKTAVFTAGNVTRDVIDVEEIVQIPAECLARPMVRLNVGIYGIADDGRVIPTINVPGPFILSGANPSGDESVSPDLPVWAQLQAQIDALGPGNGSIIVDDDGYLTTTAGGFDIDENGYIVL